MVRRLGLKTIKSPLDGYLTAVNVSVGDAVQKGQTLAIVLILKMENPVLSDREGIVREVCVKKNSRVKHGQPLMRIE
jgi:biotin carboxyl carrier protein